jgi:DNA-binding MarR family transcriptional regulator
MESLAFGLTRLSRLNNVALEERSALHGRTATESAVLGALLLGNSVLKPSVLATAIVQSPGGLTKTLRRLEKSGLIKRQPDPADRRTLVVVLTTKGRRAADLSHAETNKYYEDLLCDLSEDEQATLSSLVFKLLDRLEPAMGMLSSRGRFDPAPAPR